MLKLFKSTIIIKVIMALTGLLLVGFLFFHAAGNLQYFMGPDVYNTYATFLKEGLGEILWIMRIVLAASVILHIISAIYLRVHNNAAKPMTYQVKNYVKTKLTARTMLWTGLLLLSGFLFHILHFTGGVIEANGGHQYTELKPVGTFVMVPTKDDCCKEKKEQCGMCEEEKGCATEESKPCQTTQNTYNGYPMKTAMHWDRVKGMTIEFCGKEMSADEYTNITGKKIPERYAQLVTSEKEPTGSDLEFAKSMLIEMNTALFQAEKSEKDCCKEKAGCDMTQTKCETKECKSEDKCKGEGCPILSFFQINIADHVVGCCPQTGKMLTSYEPAMPGAVIRPRNDAYAMVTAEFSSPWVVLVYFVFVLTVGFHLNHAIESGFQTLGIQGRRFTPFIRITSIVLSVILVALMLILPLSILAKSLFGCCFGGC